MSIATSYQNYSDDWWTPPEWLEWARSTFGGDFFDPCPGTWKEGDADGLDLDWLPPTYCNHPGSRGSAQRWWSKFLEEEEYQGSLSFIWCAFSVEQLRHMTPSPFDRDGWLVMPRDRIGFIWGGPDKKVGTDKKTGEPIIRRHGERAKSPGNWTVFWTNCRPAPPPQKSLIVQTSPTMVLHV